MSDSQAIGVSSTNHKKTTISGRLSGLLRLQILNGTLPPGSKVNLDRLRETHGVSLSSVREAVSRLTADGLVELEEQRGYRIAPVTLANLIEVTRLRADMETLALGYAITQANLEWEGDVMAALHRLGRALHDPAQPDAIAVWEEAHADFHMTLVQGSGMKNLYRFCITLHNLNSRYRRIFGSDDLSDGTVESEHKPIADAALARDADLACALLRGHIERTGAKLVARIGDHLPADTR
ncbi:GntR family transcriptional regulator [Pseudogemmobacter sp. W21_MBD1_M6]|uniref:GntR family transcriptional regulator n=1 Tax=Pseudogemmobacter sp. W21_MBD1_M6 TaxID=3240271 RepID=UPI003F96E631